MASSASIEQCTVTVSTSHTYGTNWNRGRTLHRRKAKLLGNLSVANFTRLIEGHPTDQLGQITRASNGTPATESLELDIADLVGVLVNLDLELHDIATSGGADETGANVTITLLHGADIAGVVVVV